MLFQDSSRGPEDVPRRLQQAHNFLRRECAGWGESHILNPASLPSPLSKCGSRLSATHIRFNICQKCSD
eukprot:5899444-Pyramimonas_sp.AAC.1